MRKVRTAGGIIVRDNRILLIKKDGKLALVKGHIKAGETEEGAALREVLEETGYIAKVIRKIGSFSRSSKEDDGRWSIKLLRFF